MRLPYARPASAQAAREEPPPKPVHWQVLDARHVRLDEQLVVVPSRGVCVCQRLRPERAPPSAGLRTQLGRRAQGGLPYDGDLVRANARGCCDGLQELVAHELKLGGRERQGDVDAHGLAVGAQVARVAQAAELGDAARDGAGVLRAGLDVARGLAEAVRWARRAVGRGAQPGQRGEGSQRARGVLVAAHAVQRGRAGHAQRAGLIREGPLRALEAAVPSRIGLVRARRAFDACC